MRDRLPTHVSPDGAARFGLAPPRRFVLPAVLLLLAERPGYGYSLEKDLRTLAFGSIDRPTVYRALAQLEADDLVESWSEAPKAGSARRVYGITGAGERVLGAWMGVIKEERDCLSRVLERYQATGAVDALLAEVEGAWAGALGGDPSALPVWSEGDDDGSGDAIGSVRLRPLARDQPDDVGAAAVAAAVPGRPALEQRYDLVPERSVALIEVRSTVGPIRFGVIGLTGVVTAAVDDGAIRPETRPSAHLEVDVTRLRSGNGVYDAELARRIDARRFPVATVDLRECTPIGSGTRYRLAGELTMHGVTRPAHGTVAVAVTPDGRLVVTGEQVFDIRDFHVPSPTVLMFRIYPDVRVRLHVEAVAGGVR
jgi:DNA-binding PadR family transcriptional regulator/polyisoprenoid-binding protein YceI